MHCEKCQKTFMPGGEEMNVPTGFRLEISQDHSKVTAYCNQCGSILREFGQPTVLAAAETQSTKARKAKV